MVKRNQIKINEIRLKLQQQLDSKEIELIDESHLHVGHASYNPTKMHLALQATSPLFNGLSLLQRQRLVYKILQREFNDCIHALRFIALMSPD